MTALKQISLSFCDIVFLTDNIAEVTTHCGVEVGDAQVDEYHHFWETTMSAPFGVLVNKQNDYSYAFSAMRRIGALAMLRAVAVLHYSGKSQELQQLVNRVRPGNQLNMQHFFDRDRAIAWLQAELSDQSPGAAPD